jgi:hypothetical protein
MNTMPILTHSSFVERALLCVCDALSTLSEAIQRRDYFGAWTAKNQLNRAIDEAYDLTLRLPSSHRVSCLERLSQIRDLASPAVALAPAPTRAELRALHTGDNMRDRRAWDNLEQRWCSSVGSSVTLS